MAPVVARIFRNGRNQAVRIPVEMRLDSESVTIERQGDALILRPLPSGGWDRFFSDPSLVLPPDFEAGADLPAQDQAVILATIEPALGQAYSNSCRACVDGIFDQFLERARRPLDHLARGDPVDEVRGQPSY